MRAVGIVAEYNPFHRGHAHHLAEAKWQSGADIAAAVMSGWFTQRGEPALLAPVDRVRMALAAGVDAVFLLPSFWAVRDAEHFALAGVSLLDRLGCDAISFGAETDDLPLMQAAAALLEEEPEQFREALRGLLDKGLAHPAAVSEAADLVFPGVGTLLRKPNNTLAVCYLRAMRRLDSRMRPYPVRREGAYHAEDLDAVHPSATAVRLAIREERTEEALNAVPDACRPILADAVAAGDFLLPDALDTALRYRLLTMGREELRALPGLSEGLEDRLLDAARRCASREAMLAMAKTRRYPEARLSRLMAHALLRVTQDDFDRQPLPPCVVILGLTGNALPLLRRAEENGLPIFGKAADWIHLPDPWARTEALAGDLWALGRGKPAGAAARQQVLRPR
ncbi:MAG: nucleotidyltransferase family protein [Clostridia bacterium]|nr:nucleotidyltransferase family protein [Clostridia bacterium]